MGLPDLGPWLCIDGRGAVSEAQALALNSQAGCAASTLFGFGLLLCHLGSGVSKQLPSKARAVSWFGNSVPQKARVLKACPQLVVLLRGNQIAGNLTDG
jgi:hypothetical protein